MPKLRRPNGLNILDRLPDRGGRKLAAIQGRIDADLWEQVKAELDQRNVTWNNFMTVVCENFMAEVEEERKRSGGADG